MSAAAVSTLTGWVVLPDGEVALALGVEVTLDERWSPYVQASVVIDHTPERAALVDPRPGAPRVRVGVRRAWANRPTLEDLSTEWVGLVVEDLSTEWVGLAVDDLSTAWTVEWESGDRASDTLTADLTVRGRVVDLVAETITISAVSDELLAQDAHMFLVRPAESLSSRVRAALDAAGVGGGSDLSAGDGVSAGALTSATASFTSSVWDLLARDVTAAGLRLYCDEQRVWRLVDPTADPTISVEVTRVTAASDTVALDGDYADAYGVLLTGSDAGAPVYLFDTYPYPVPAGPVRISFDVEDHPEITGGIFPSEIRPTPERLAAQFQRLNSQGRTLSVTAPADPTIRPGVAITTGAPSLPALDGVVAAVTIRVPEDTMQITTRSTVDGA